MRCTKCDALYVKTREIIYLLFKQIRQRCAGDISIVTSQCLIRIFSQKRDKGGALGQAMK